MQARSDGLEKTDISELAVDNDEETDHTPLWVPSGCRLISGLLGLNVVLLGGAFLAGDALNPTGLKHQEPELFLLALMGLSLLWMLWFLLWARRQPGPQTQTDHHAGSTTVMVVLMLFAGLSLLLCVFRASYYLLLRECQSLTQIISPFIQAPFFALQAYLLWAHSKDCIHKHKVYTRFGLMVTLCTDILLWFCAVTDDSVHMEIEMEKQDKDLINNTSAFLAPQETKAGLANSTLCQCSASAVCLALRQGYEILYPFNMEFSLLAGCMLYVMWKNVGHHWTGIHTEHAQKSSLNSVLRGGVLFGPVLGLLVLLTGATVFVLYHVWVGQSAEQSTAFVLFYSFHLALMPVMALCSLAGTMVQNKKVQEQIRHEGKRGVREKQHDLRWWVQVQGESKNPTQSLDVVLLVGTAVGQLSLSYLSLVAALALEPIDIVSNLELSYSMLCVVELMLQNAFIIKGLHLHKHSHVHLHTHLQMHAGLKTNKKDLNSCSKVSFKVDAANVDELEDKNETPVTPAGHDRWKTDPCNRRVIQEICAFLIMANITLWMIPAFGAHPELESGLGKQFFGFSVWFVLVNLSQPLTVFYRMHSVGALMELLLSA
ncbi:proton channel OTOP3-like [Salminus brasiliensis]|uniref:proton channel OTOP3-like n=1 Tax=Salminus brasiliensis TaxID=930266 RepID=UPI003B831710